MSAILLMIALNPAYAVSTIPKLPYDYGAAADSCARFDRQTTYSSDTYNLHPAALVITIGYGTSAYANQCQATICTWSRQGNVDYSWLTPPVCYFVPSSGNPVAQRV